MLLVPTEILPSSSCSISRSNVASRTSSESCRRMKRAAQLRCSTPLYLRALTTIEFCSPFDSLLPATLLPIGQELCLPLIGQRMIEQLVDNLKRHRRDVGAQAGRFDHMNRIPQTRSEHFSLPVVVLIDLDNVAQQDQSVLSDIVESAQEGRDEGSPGFGCQDGLRSRETESDIYLDSLMIQLARRLEAVFGERTFHHYIRCDLRVLQPFAHHPVL